MASFRKDMGMVRGSPPCHMNHTDSNSSETSFTTFSKVSSDISPGTRSSGV